MIKKYLLTTLALMTISFASPLPASEYEEEDLKCVEDYITSNYTNREEKAQKKAEIYEKAAIKRRKTAEIQAQYGADLLSQASSNKLNSPDKENELQRLNRYSMAGDLELKAADAQIGAAINYAGAASNGNNALNNYKKIQKEKSDKLKKDLSKDTKLASDYYTKAIKTCIEAASTYSTAENQEKQAKATEKAATILEFIVYEKPEK
jgi:hypothetical protein